MMQAIPKDKRESRAELIRIGNSYFTGLDTDNSGANVPFDPKCQRRENGIVTSNNPDAALLFYHRRNFQGYGRQDSSDRGGSDRLGDPPALPVRQQEFDVSRGMLQRLLLNFEKAVHLHEHDNVYFNVDENRNR